MKLILNKNQLQMSADQFLRQAGYAFHRDHRSGKESYGRRLGRGFFPKFHMYFDENDNQVIFNLHLDQKQASYEGYNMHSGEYDGEVVEREIERLKSYFKTEDTKPGDGGQKPNISESEKKGELLDRLGGNRDYLNRAPRKEEKKPWWKKLF